MVIYLEWACHSSAILINSVAQNALGLNHTLGTLDRIVRLNTTRTTQGISCTGSDHATFKLMLHAC